MCDALLGRRHGVPRRLRGSIQTFRQAVNRRGKRDTVPIRWAYSVLEQGGDLLAKLGYAPLRLTPLGASLSIRSIQWSSQARRAGRRSGGEAAHGLDCDITLCLIDQGLAKTEADVRKSECTGIIVSVEAAGPDIA